MKKKELKSLFEKSVKELQRILRDWTKEMLDMRFRLKTGKLKDLHALMKKRHNIARIKTIIRKKEIGR
ncbi:MAG TPA: 50S ribosomal protein L29 [Candidatus Bathyarchaeia archaeon]|nr:50S ribosomal protein L29 [Candidatus Bathyarchaeia archaeon]